MSPTLAPQMIRLHPGGYLRADIPVRRLRLRFGEWSDGFDVCLFVCFRLHQSTSIDA
jgi:hypothetical protein